MRARIPLIAVLAAVVVGTLVVTFWLYSTSALTTNRAYSLACVFMWGVTIVILGRQSARGRLTPLDNEHLNWMGFGCLICGATVVGSELSLWRSESILAPQCFSSVLVLAIDVISRHALFTQEERETLDSRRRRRRA